MEKTKIEISTTTIFKVILAAVLVWFLYAIKEILFLFFIVLVIVAALNPLVDRMSKYIPRIVALLILSVIFLGILVAIGFLFVPPVVAELKQLSINLPVILDRFGPIYQSLQDSISSYQEGLFNISSQIGRLTSGIYTTTIGFISAIVALFTILVLSFYMLLEKESIKTFLEQTVPLDHKERIYEVLKKIGNKMGNWIRGQALLMLVIGVLDLIALLILGIPYALVLAVWGGLTEIIPYIGPWLGLIPAAAIGFTISPLTGILVIVAYIVIQQLEAQFLAPKIMGRAVGLSPVIIILALLIGAKLMGIWGVLVAVPIAAALSVLLQEWPELKKIKG